MKKKKQRILVEKLVKNLERQCVSGTLAVGQVLVVNGATLGVIQALTVNEIECEKYLPVINGNQSVILIKVVGIEKDIIAIDVPPTITELELLRYI